MTLTQLSAFILVARLGSVKDAAKVLGVSEPAVSQAIAALRQHMNDQLITRGTGGMTLTWGGLPSRPRGKAPRPAVHRPGRVCDNLELIRHATAPPITRDRQTGTPGASDAAEAKKSRLDVPGSGGESLLGVIGRVTVSIPANGPGEVLIPVRGGSEAFAAWSDEPIARHTRVLVIECTSARSVVVMPFP